MIERKQTFIVQKTLVKIKSPKGNCLEARPKTKDDDTSAEDLDNWLFRCFNLR